jgi:hypothetical protein
VDDEEREGTVQGSCGFCAVRWSSSGEARVGSMTKQGRPGMDGELHVASSCCCAQAAEVPALREGAAAAAPEGGGQGGRPGMAGRGVGFFYFRFKDPDGEELKL